MTATLIDRMEVKKDGVYLSTHLSGDAGSHRTWMSEELTEAYQTEGQKGLDREMFLILHEFAELGASHKSTARYHYVSNLPETKTLRRECFNQIDAFENSGKSPSEFRIYNREMRDKLYGQLAEKCGEYDRKQRNKDHER